MDIKKASVKDDIACWMCDNDVVLKEKAHKELVNLLSFYYGQPFAHFIILGKDRIVYCDESEPGAIATFTRCGK